MTQPTRQPKPTRPLPPPGILHGFGPALSPLRAVRMTPLSGVRVAVPRPGAPAPRVPPRHAGHPRARPEDSGRAGQGTVPALAAAVVKLTRAVQLRAASLAICGAALQRAEVIAGARSLRRR